MLLWLLILLVGSLADGDHFHDRVHTLASREMDSGEVESGTMASAALDRRERDASVDQLEGKNIKEDPAGVTWQLTTSSIGMPGLLRESNEGLTHDKDGFIYLNSKGTLFKCALQSNNELKIVAKNTQLIPRELQEKGYNHVGDIDEADGIIYIGIEYSTTSPGVLASVNSTTLEVMNWTITDQGGAPWVAVDGDYIYSSHWSDTTKLNLWNRNDFSFQKSIYAKEGVELPKEIQGAAFYDADPGFIYLAVDGPAVYRFDATSGSTCEFVLKDAYDHHPYEMEGITFMDLEHRGLGTLHVYGNFQSLREEKSIHNFSPFTNTQSLNQQDRQ